MVKNLLKFLHADISGLHEAAYLLGAFALLSQLLALFRDRLFASAFGAGEILDAYFSAFRIPDFILICAASLVSASILIPILFEKEKAGPDGEKKFINEMFSAFFVLIIGLSAVAFFIAPVLIPILFHGFSEETISDTVILTRIILLQPILLGVSNLFGSIVQARRRFFVYAISPLLYNIGIIFGVLFLFPTFGISGLAWGVVVGAFLHLLIQVPTVRSAGLFPSWTFKWNLMEMKRVVFISVTRAMALGTSQLITLFLLAVASSVGAGSVAIFMLAWNLQSVPLSIIGISYSLAAFPTLARLFEKNKQNCRGEFLNAISTTFISIVFWSLPASALFIVLRAQIVRVVLGAGEFNWTDTRLAAAALALFAVSAVAQGLILLFTRAFYSAGSTARPLLANVSTGVATVGFGYGFAALFTESAPFRFFIESLLRVSDVSGTAVLALPLAYSIGAFLNLFVLWFLFSSNGFGLWKIVRRPLLESASSSIIAGAVSYVGLNLFDDFFNLQKTTGIFFQGFLAGLIGVAAWVFVLYLLKSRELAAVWATLHRKIWRLPSSPAGEKLVSPDMTENPTI